MNTDLKSWQNKAQRRLNQVVETLSSFPKLGRLPCVREKGAVRQASVRIVGRSAMQVLNKNYRGKNYPTDVLSFPVPEPFARMGILGELVICLPVLKAQAVEQKHSASLELDILLVHGVLHLLGFDHELGPKQAREMASWEAKLLASLLASASKKKTPKGLGLIERTYSGTKVK